MDLDDVILSMTLTNVMQEPSVNIPAWSISAEWFAYLLCPAILWVTTKWNGKKLNIFLLGAICILYPLLFHKFFCCSGIVGAGAILRVFSGFIAGILLYKLYQDQFLFTGKKIFSDLIGFGALISIYILTTLKTDFSLIYPFLIVFVYSLAICRSYLRNIFASKIMLFLGTISYCLYMIHYTVLEAFSVFLSDYLYTTEASQAIYWLILLSISAVLIAAASTLYFLLEKPARTWLTKASFR